MNTSTAFHPALADTSSLAAPASRSEPAIPFRRISVRTAIWSLLLGAAFVCPALLLLRHLPVAPLTAEKLLKIAQYFPLVVLGSAILGPVMEEIIFRGAIIQLGRRRLPVAVPVVFSVLLFAGIHLPKGLGVVVLAVMAGGLLTWMALRSHSLWPGLLCHVAFNTTAFILTAAFGIMEKVLALPVGSAPNSAFADAVPLGATALSVVLIVSALVMLRREFARPASA